MIKTIFLILVTIFIPPLGVFFVAGCSMDLLINILLTLLGYLPGHVHAFYLEYVYMKRRDERRSGVVDTRPAPGVYSSKVQNGGTRVREERVVQQPMAPPAQQGYGTV
ncbi:hypothetical protein DE146DRAFT_638304 [Phaeosphaeria sp. MPI-PUGE-AT-0046c]|nr:hypothetical protein DE146DRAFT_638304 [Phaeosphaeria sp. MPI-PUGE-AT-0046c]